jgi:hypothetical protein
MSYSFSFKADTKDAAKAKAAEEFDRLVVASQPVHARDRDAALANAGALIDLCTDPADGEELAVSMNGSISTRGWDPKTEYANAVLTAASASASVYIATRTA